MTHLDLFSGIGGIALAARWAGFSTRLFCEIDPYCCRVLNKHWPEVPIHGDVRLLTEEVLDGHGLDEVTLLTGGFPCQPFSQAGKRRGKADDRYLWPAMLDVIRHARPAWVVGENVAGFVRLALDTVLADLEAEGYECETLVLPAAGVGARHRRNRCFVVARDADRQSEETIGLLAEGDQVAESRRVGRSSAYPQPVLRRSADGFSARMDRLRGLGNAVVPQQIYPILKAIADIEAGCPSEAA